MAKTRVIAGVDIGSSKVATLIGQYNQEEDKMSVVGVASTASKGVRKGQIVDIEEAASSVVESVEAAERMAGYGLGEAYITIGGAHIESQNSQGVVAVSDPSGEIDKNDVERVIEAARAVSLASSREILHVMARDYKVDGETLVKDPEGMSGVRLEANAHLITGSSTAVKNIEKCISEAGISPLGIVFSALASSEAVLTDTERELGVVLVDVGAGTTSVVAFLEGSLAYTSVYPIGAKNVTNDIAAGLRISLEGAEKFKIELGKDKEKGKSGEEKAPSASSGQGTGEDEVDFAELGVYEDGARKVSKKTLIEGIIRPRLNEIFTMVGMGLTEAKVAGKTPSGIVITGGGAMTVGGLESARRMLSLPARIGYPRGVAGLIEEIASPSYASGVGLLMWGRKESGSSKGGWSGRSFVSRIEGIRVKGILGRVGEVIKNLLP